MKDNPGSEGDVEVLVMSYFIHKNKNREISKRYKKAIKYKTFLSPPPPRHGGENKYRERKKRKTIYQIPTRQRRNEDKEAERKAWEKKRASG
jgi:hypothetical protein